MGDRTRLSGLVALAASLASAEGVDDVAKVVVQAAASQLRPDRIAVMLGDAEPGRLRIAAAHNVAPTLEQQYATFSVDDPFPASEAMRTDRVVVLETLEERDRRFPAMRGWPASPTLVQVPLRPVAGPPIGVVSIGFAEERSVGEPTLEFLSGLAHLCGIALARAQLHERQQRALDRQSFLAEGGQVLSGTLDPSQVVQRLARLAVPALADVSSICLADDDGTLRPVAVAHAEPEGQPIIDQLAARQPEILDEDLLRVFHDRVSLLTSDVPADHYLQRVDEDHRSLLRRLSIASGLAVPLVARDRPIGTLALLMTTSGRRLEQEDLTFAEDVAARAALAIDNARLHQDRVERARNLEGVLQSRVAVEQAKGYLAARWGVGVAEAFKPLRAHARRTRRPIHDVADDVVAGRLPPEALLADPQDATG